MGEVGKRWKTPLSEKESDWLDEGESGTGFHLEVEEIQGCEAVSRLTGDWGSEIVGWNLIRVPLSWSLEETHLSHFQLHAQEPIHLTLGSLADGECVIQNKNKNPTDDIAAWKWFESYLEGRHYQVTWNEPTQALHWCPLRLGVGSSSLFSLHSFSWRTCLTDIGSWMTAHHLKLNPSKTELLFIPSTTGPHHDLTISFGNSVITPTEDAGSLGEILHGQLSFSAHIANLTRSSRFLLYTIRRIRPFLSQEATQLLVQSLVISRLEYCISLLAGLPLRTIRPL
ncbi:hypothetical protein NFI96_006854 [Prochilodus magdalenae]|nr:hypothetical protein NFI96_006854 [Prochilodus magdalenae]